MQHLCSDSRRHSRISAGFRTCQGQVRFCALHRIKPHTPPLVRAPVNSFEFQSCDRTPQAGYLLRLLRHGGFNPSTLSTHRLGRGLPGYLILFAPHAFVSQCQDCSRKPPSPPAFLLISTHFTATPEIPLPSPSLQPASLFGIPIVKLRPFTKDLTNHLQTLYAQ